MYLNEVKILEGSCVVGLAGLVFRLLRRHISRCLSNRPLYQIVQNMEGKLPLPLFIIMRFQYISTQQKSSNYSYRSETEVRKKIQSESRRISKVWIIQQALQK